MLESTHPAPLILASTSSGRRNLLRRLGIEFTQVPSLVDEAPLQAKASDPIELARSLALAKASAVSKIHPQALIIGGDQVLALGDQLLGKPGSKPAAVEQLMLLAGRSHQLITASALVGPDGTPPEVWVEVAQMTLAPLDRATIERYVDADDPSHCAGSYKLEAKGITLFERIECEDWNGIVGLPLMGLARRLRARGYPLP